VRSLASDPNGPLEVKRRQLVADEAAASPTRAVWSLVFGKFHGRTLGGRATEPSYIDWLVRTIRTGWSSPPGPSGG
jgi:hypothetical protein